MSIYVIGACNIDITATTDKRVIAHDSVPARITMDVGGVGHNVALNARHIYDEVYLVSLFGTDYFGKRAKEHCQKRGLNLSYSNTVDMTHSIYLAILDASGDMVTAVNDMAIVDAMDYELIKPLEEVITDKDYLMVDNNLSVDLQLEIYKRLKGCRFTDAISVSKADKLKSSLAYIDILKVNRYEAEALVDYDFADERSIIEGLNALVQKGVREVILSDKYGAYIANKEAIIRYRHNAYKEHIVNATGAGDALLGTYVASLALGYKKEEAIKQALIAALITVEDTKTVADINMDALKKRNTEQIKGVSIYDKN